MFPFTRTPIEGDRRIHARVPPPQGLLQLPAGVLQLRTLQPNPIRSLFFSFAFSIASLTSLTCFSSQDLRGNIRVFARVRPLLPFEKKKGCVSCVNFPRPDEVSWFVGSLTVRAIRWISLAFINYDNRTCGCDYFTIHAMCTCVLSRDRPSFPKMNAVPKINNRIFFSDYHQKHTQATRKYVGIWQGIVESCIYARMTFHQLRLAWALDHISPSHFCLHSCLCIGGFSFD